MKYRIGKPSDLRDDDPWFNDEREAIEAAAQLHRESKDEIPVAVWDEQCRYVWLFFDGEMFRTH